MTPIIARVRDWLGGAPARIPAHPETHQAICYQCGVFHPLTRNIWQGFLDFAEKHTDHRHLLGLLPVAHDQFMQFSHLRPNADMKIAFGSSTGMTCTLASLADSATVGRESTAVVNSSNLYLDAIVYLACALQTGTPTAPMATFIYAYGSEDGTNYTDNATGTDAAITLRAPSNLPIVHTIKMPASGALTYKSLPIAMGRAGFGGALPRAWGIVVRNDTGVTFSATEGNHTKTYSGVYMTVV